MPIIDISDKNMQDKTPVIEIEGLKKQYPGAIAPSIKDFSLVCHEGDIVGLLGHNGAGKSTTLKCLTGMLPFDGGSIRINGYDIKTSPVKAKFTFGFVSDKHDVFVKMTGLQYINFMADAYDVSKELRAERLKKLDELFGLGARLKEPISNYSHGMRQKVCMMGSLIHSPKLWILDEPMIGLDPMTSEKVAQFMKEYAKQGNCILFSSHNVNSVQKICSRAVIINNGAKTDDIVIADWNDEAHSSQTLEEFFLARTAKNEAKEDTQNTAQDEKLQNATQNDNAQVIKPQTSESSDLGDME